MLALLPVLVGCRHESERAAGPWMIVFQSDRDGEWATYAIDPDGTDRVRVAPSDGPAAGAAIASPDGTQAVVPGANELRLVRAGGRASRRLAGGLPSTAAWSPDGKRIAFVGLSPGISVIDADGDNGRRLTRNRGDANPAWSPDGDRLAFTREGVGVVVVDSDGRRRRVVAGEDGRQIRWSQDGRSLSFVVGDYPFAVITVSVSNGRTVRRVGNLGADEPIAWSRDGRWIAYRRWPHLIVMRADGTQRRRVARHASEPAWSPDSRSIAYVKWMEGRGRQLFVVRRDGTGTRRVTEPYPNGGNVMQPGWVRGPLAATPSPYRLRPKRRGSGATLDLPYPVVTMGAAGSLVVIAAPPRLWGTVWVVSPPLVLWDPVRGRISRIARLACNGTDSVAVLSRRVAYDCTSGHAASFGRSVEHFEMDVLRPSPLASGWIGEGNRRSSLPGRLAGGGDLVVFSRTPVRGWRWTGAPRSLWRNRRGRTDLVIRNLDRGEPAAVAAGRIAVEQADGAVTLFGDDGRLRGRVLPGGRTRSARLGEVLRPTVALTNAHVVVLHSGRLSVFDVHTLRRLRAIRVPARAKLAGAASGLAAFVTPGVVHVMRLADGRRTAFRTGRRGVEARVASAGLFYVLHRRPVAGHQSYPFVENPARVVFIRRAALLRRLRTSR